MRTHTHTSCILLYRYDRVRVFSSARFIAPVDGGGVYAKSSLKGRPRAPNTNWVIVIAF